MDSKPFHFHYCNIISEYNILKSDSYQTMDVVLNVPPPNVKWFHLENTQKLYYKHQTTK